MSSIHKMLDVQSWNVGSEHKMLPKQAAGEVTMAGRKRAMSLGWPGGLSSGGEGEGEGEVRGQGSGQGNFL